MRTASRENHVDITLGELTRNLGELHERHAGWREGHGMTVAASPASLLVCPVIVAGGPMATLAAVYVADG
ncbi:MULTISPECIES: hypothetical protein [unclassified Streptomyces]|uniref:hypothetical protein n=1 Tax=unclassified Streptomyces TaxID=2593676 RepID=UPI0019083709|nr:hypothetical protein [Streptomyces sp. HSG2]